MKEITADEWSEAYYSLTAFEESGTIPEFLYWVDNHPHWGNVRYSLEDNIYLIQRSTLSQVALAVMRRESDENHQRDD